jgi:two-component system, NarL family, nitrate/nitrite response regulator NarL
MNIIVVTPVRLLGDGLISCLSNRSGVNSVTIAHDFAALREALLSSRIDAVLVDVTQGIDLFDVRTISTGWPDVHLVALGLNEQRKDVIACGRNGFAGYVARDASVDALCEALTDVVAGRLSCPPEISGGLFRALCGSAPQPVVSEPDPALTRRETEVLQLIGRGLSNKEIGSELYLSVATVKHHVHRILEKLRLTRRADAMRRVQDTPWIVRLTSMRRRVGEP